MHYLRLGRNVSQIDTNRRITTNRREQRYPQKHEFSKANLMFVAGNVLRG